FSQAERGAADHAAWNAVHAAAHADRVAELDRGLWGEMPQCWETSLPDFTGADAQATRQSSGACIQALAKAIPEFVGGSADLAASTTSDAKGPHTLPGADGQGARERPGRAALQQGERAGRLGPSRQARGPYVPFRHP